jgi:hypothetical protein
MGELDRRSPWGCIALALAVMAFSATRPEAASARASGITGVSGKQGGSCNQFLCHAGGVEPEARFEGPERMEPEETAAYRFVVVSRSPAQVAAGFNIAASDGFLDALSTDPGVRKEGSELTQVSPRRNDAEGVAFWDFGWTAPSEPGEYVLFGAGNSVDLSFDQGGDLAAAVTFAVQVGGEATPTPTPVAPSCTGDCNGDGRVAIDELVVGVNIAVELLQIGVCPAIDVSGDGQASIGDLVQAVGNALRGCG